GRDYCVYSMNHTARDPTLLSKRELAKKLILSELRSHCQRTCCVFRPDFTFLRYSSADLNFLAAIRLVYPVYVLVTSVGSPSMISSPCCIQMHRFVISRIVGNEWLTRNTQPAWSRSSSIRAPVRSRNWASPVLSASSMMRISGSMLVAIANCKRDAIPDEYAFIGNRRALSVK